MRIACYAFTDTGKALAGKLADILDRHTEHTAVMCLQRNNLQTVGEQFAGADALLFIGACGIAVRAVAPYLDSKLTDPAVLVMDELGRHIIPVLSGHYGGANELALELSALTGAEPVITTATDMQGRFAVDVFAKKNNLRLIEAAHIKLVSGALLRGEPVGCKLQVPVVGELPEGLTLQPDARIGICVGYEQTRPFNVTLHLIPRDVVVGIGCRRGKSFAELHTFLQRTLCSYGLDESRVLAIASIDRKAKEPGLVRMAQSLRVPFYTYTAKLLRLVPGEFTTSGFVESQVEVDNVCERSALLAASLYSAHGRIHLSSLDETGDVPRLIQTADTEWIARKYAEHGMTIAMVRRIPDISFST